MDGFTFSFSLTAFQADLLQMVMLLLVVMMGSGVVSALIFRNHYTCLGLIIWAIAMGGSLFLLYMGSELTNSAVVTVLLSIIFGASAGAMLGGYTQVRLSETPDDRRKKERLTTVLGVLAISTVLAGLVGIFGGKNFQHLESYLFVGLFVVLGIILLQFFFKFGKIWDTVIGAAVSLFWIVYMVVDFNKITAETVGEATWGLAARVAANIYLDILNLFLWLWDVID